MDGLLGMAGAVNRRLVSTGLFLFDNRPFFSFTLFFPLVFPSQTPQDLLVDGDEPVWYHVQQQLLASVPHEESRLCEYSIKNVLILKDGVVHDCCILIVDVR